MSNKPSIPKGTRDFSPAEMTRRNYIFDTIKKVYKKYGFQQIETPAMENLETLVGTGGDESDTLIFKILNSGDYLKNFIFSKDEMNKIDDPKFRSPVNKWLSAKDILDSSKHVSELSEKALHYDLTVPFARYVVQNQNDITFPFRRFQIQPVWRADKPQKGRYREFYQCDADIIGSDSLLNEVDLIKIIDDVFGELFQGKLDYTISINNRKILQGIVESVGAQDKFEQIVVAIDKFDKIGREGVLKELMNLELNEYSIESLFQLILNRSRLEEVSTEDLKASNFIKVQLEDLSSKIDNKNGQEGIKELQFIVNCLKGIDFDFDSLKFDPTLARGLGYYTGTIIEVKVDNFPSICGGGRYDDLTGKFGLKDVSGVGISFGADRIYDVLLDNDLYPPFKGDSTQVLFTNQTGSDEDVFLPMLFKLRAAGINAEIYPDEVKWKRQMNYASKKEIEYIVSSNFDGELFVKKAEEQDKVMFKTAEDLINLIQK